MLRALAVFNWVLAGLIVLAWLVFCVVGFGALEMPMLLGVTAVMMTFAGLYFYAGALVEQGRARLFQTVLAIVSLFNFPVGTIYGFFALWVCWSAEYEAFENGGLLDYDHVKPREPAAATPRRRVERGLSPYAAAKALQAEGAPPFEIQALLTERGLEADEVETLMKTLGLRYVRPRARQR